MQSNNQKDSELKLWIKLLLVTLGLAVLGFVAYVIFGEDDFAKYFKGFIEANPYLLLGVGAALALGIGLLLYYSRHPAKASWQTREIVFAALCIALSFVLSYIKVWKMPMGGSVTPASMLPIMVFAYIYGPGKGLMVSLAFAVLQIIQEPVYLNFVQFTLDYFVGFGVLAAAGFFRNNLRLGVVLSSLLRFICSFISGFVFFGEYASEGMSPVVYSLGYNGTYMLPELIICLTVTFLPGLMSAIESMKRQALARKQEKTA